MNYPQMLNESATLDCALNGDSLSRFGDGELRICHGGQAPSQEHHPKLQMELRAILKKSVARCCIPTPAGHSPADWFWQKYMDDKFVKLYSPEQKYGSAWVTRSDNAPWIDTDEYWNRVTDLWRNKDVVLVTGDEKSLTPHFMHDAKSIRFVHGPRTNAYAQIDRIEEEIGTPNVPVLMCLGATATVLAERLSRKGCHALDLGHVGMFMKRWNKRLTIDDLITPEYRALLKQQHVETKWGTAGRHHVGLVEDWAKRIGAKTILDYGCGRGTLAGAVNKYYEVREFEPGIPGKDAMPEPADMIVCTDVLEHVERDRLKNVLWHIKTLSTKGAFLIIALAKAKETLADGRNAHLIVEPANWWIKQLTRMGIRVSNETKMHGALVVWVKHVEP